MADDRPVPVDGFVSARIDHRVVAAGVEVPLRLDDGAHADGNLHERLEDHLLADHHVGSDAPVGSGVDDGLDAAAFRGIGSSGNGGRLAA